MTGCAQGADQEDVAAVRVGDAVAQYALGRHAEALRIAAVVHTDAVGHPAQDVGHLHARELRVERCEPRRQQLVGHAHGRSAGGKVGQHVVAHVAQVLLAERGEHLFGIGINGKEALYRAPVGTCTHQARIVVALIEGRVGVSLSKAVLVGQALAVECLLGVADGRQVVVPVGRHKVEVKERVRVLRELRALSEPDRHLLVLPHAGVAEAEAAVAVRPDEQAAQSERHGGAALRIGLLRGQRIELALVVEAELHGGILHGLSLTVRHTDDEASHGRIVVRDVDFGVARVAAHHLLGPVVAAEDLGVHHHAATGGLIEPTLVEHGFRLAGAEEMPLPIDPCLHPRVVVVGVRPARRIDLTCRNAHGPQGSHAEGALLATAPDGGTHGGKRRRGARVGRLIGDVLVAPVVHLQHRIVHR